MALRLQPTALPQPMALLKRMPLLENMPVAPTVALPVPRDPLGNNLVYTPGSGPPPYDVPRQVYASQSAGPWEWHAAPGPNKRGNMCITHTDPMRGYGFQAECKK
jgi:hypothetical protein